MNAVSNAMVTNASAADVGSVSGAAAIAVLKKSMDQQASAAATLIAALPQPQLATSGAVGTQVNTYA